MSEKNTDLINTGSVSDQKNDHKNGTVELNAELIEKRIPAPVLKVMKTLQEAGYEAWLVGGCLRDLLMGREPHDYDLTTSARPETVQQLFPHHADTGIKHGTVMVIEDGIPVEVTTFRKEGKYSDSRHPDEVIFVDTIDEDLKRRDFTINAMAWNPEKGVLDLFDGKEDLKNGLIRAVGDPNVRIQEDALRMLRAWRFASQLGFEVEENTRKALKNPENIAKVKDLAVERVFEELTKILMSDHPEVIAEMTDLLEPWIPELKIMLNTEQINPHHYTDVLHHTLDAIRRSESSDPMVRWALLLHDTGKPEVKTTKDGIDHFKMHEKQSSVIARRVLRDMHAPKAWIKTIPELVLRHDAFYAPNLSNIYKLRVQLGWPDHQLRQLFEIQKGDILAHTTYDRMALLNRFRDFYDAEILRRPLSYQDLAVSGDDVLAHTGLKGKQIGQALDELLRIAFYHPECNTKEELLARLPGVEKSVLNQEADKGSFQDRKQKRNMNHKRIRKSESAEETGSRITGMQNSRSDSSALKDEKKAEAYFADRKKILEGSSS